MGGGLEIVDESCGRLVAPDDANVLGQVLGSLIMNSSKRAELSSGGLLRALALCEPARQLTQLHDLLSGLVIQEAVA
jgi:hypothetical protein